VITVQQKALSFFCNECKKFQGGFFHRLPTSLAYLMNAAPWTICGKILGAIARKSCHEKLSIARLDKAVLIEVAGAKLK